MFYVVEGSYVVKVDPDAGTVERRMEDGSWQPYPHLDDVALNGRVVDEAEAEAFHAEKFGGEVEDVETESPQRDG